MLALPLSLSFLLTLGGTAPPDGDPPDGRLSDVIDHWSFPEVRLEVGERLPNFRLPTITSGEPVALYDALDGRPTLLHVYASW